MLERVVYIIIGSLIGTLMILSVIYEYNLKIEDAIQYTIMVLGGITVIAVSIALVFTCFVKTFDSTETKKEDDLFEKNIKRIPIYSFESNYRKMTPPSRSISVDMRPPIIVNPNYPPPSFQKN